MMSLIIILNEYMQCNFKYFNMSNKDLYKLLTKSLGNLVNLTISGKHGKLCDLSIHVPFQRHIIHYNWLLLSKDMAS